MSAPFLSFDTKKEAALGELKKSFNDPEGYWKMIRKQFPLKEGQTYFNNGTMGPTPSYVLDKMINHMLHYNTEAASIDYKNGSGPELLTGYFPYEELRTKLGKIINCDFKEIALVQNATFGMNYVGMGLNLKEGDELLNTDQEHGGASGHGNCWLKEKDVSTNKPNYQIPPTTHNK